MRVALFQPFVPDLNTTPPLGPLYLAAVLEKEGFEVTLFDEKIDYEVFKKIVLFKPDIFAVSAVTPAYLRGLQVSRELKKLFPSLKVVFGGPHPSALPLLTLKEDIIDYIVIGEGEKIFPVLCRKIRENNDSYKYLKEIKNIGFKRNNGELFITEKDDYISEDELDKIPYPAFHLMDLNTYFTGLQMHGIYQRGSRILPIMTSRGCPYTCTFCCRVMGNVIRKKSIDKFASEIDYLIRKYKIDELYIEDDNFTADKNRALELLKVIKKSKIKYLKFANGVNINIVDEEILKSMKEAKVYSISFGIESGSANTLKKMHKYIDLERTKKMVGFAKSLGLLVGGNCIIGYPGESLADIRYSLDYFFKLNLDSMAIVNLVPFPGTEVRNECEKKGYLTEESKVWSNYYFSINNPIPLIETPLLSKKQLVVEIKRAYRKKYFNIFWLIRALRNIRLSRLFIGLRIYFGFISFKKLKLFKYYK